MYKILYIEDEFDMRDDMPAVLAPYDLQVTSPGSIIEALGLFQEQDFDLVLLDICMPPTEDMPIEEIDYGRATGLEVARRLKAIKPEVRLVAFTVVRDEEMLHKMRVAGICHVINKPSGVQEIANGISSVLAASHK